MNDTDKPRIILPSNACNVSIRNVSLHMYDRIQQPLEAFMKELAIYSRALGIDFGDDFEQALKLITREGAFIDSPSEQKARDLSSDWAAWADSVFLRLQNGAIDPHYPNFKRRLREFVEELDVSRSTFLS